MLSKMITTLANKKGAIILTGTFAGLTFLSAKTERKDLEDFNRKYPGETPKRTYHHIPITGGYWTYERDEQEMSSSPSSPKK